MKKARVEIVTWADAFKCEDPQTIEEATNIAPEHYTVITTGWVIRDDKEWLVLAHEFYTDSTCRGVTSIPAGWVIERKKL